MARFLKHTACPQCGSSDANALYDDGSQFCFSCRKPKGSKVSPYAQNYRRDVLEKSQSEAFSQRKIILPFDASSDFSVQAVAWFSKYEISLPVILKAGVVFSKQRNQVIFPFYDDNKNLLAYQARNLSAESKKKRYYTTGDINELLTIYNCNSMDYMCYGYTDLSNSNCCASSRSLVLVEDCLSAIKIASTEGLGADALPLLGSGISRLKLSRLRPFYDVLDVWLDPDMWHNSLKIVKQAQLLGFEARAVKSEYDPKEHSYEDIKKFLTA